MIHTLLILKGLWVGYCGFHVTRNLKKYLKMFEAGPVPNRWPELVPHTKIADCEHCGTRIPKLVGYPGGGVILSTAPGRPACPKCNTTMSMAGKDFWHCPGCNEGWPGEALRNWALKGGWTGYRVHSGAQQARFDYSRMRNAQQAFLAPQASPAFDGLGGRSGLLYGDVMGTDPSEKHRMKT